jgi:hypothetical protein
MKVNTFRSHSFEIRPFDPNLNQFNLASKRDRSRKYNFSFLFPAGTIDRPHGRNMYIQTKEDLPLRMKPAYGLFRIDSHNCEDQRVCGYPVIVSVLFITERGLFCVARHTLSTQWDKITAKSGTVTPAFPQKLVVQNAKIKWKRNSTVRE